MIDRYIKLRNRMAAIKQKHVDELDPYNKAMLGLEAELMRHLNTTKLDSVNGPAGTAYKQVATSVTVDDWTKTLAYIQNNNQWDLLEARVAKTAVLTIMDETKKAIPGVKVSQAVVLRVRTG